MINTSIPKSFVNVETAFRKDLTLQGHTTLPTRADRLLASSSTPSLACRLIRCKRIYNF
jgi:hypothetical protein